MRELKIIPKVNEWHPSAVRTLKVTLPILYLGYCPEAELFPLEKDKKGDALLFLMQGEEIPAEGYQLEIETDRVVLHYGDDAGRFYGLTTLFEIIRTEGDEISCGRIADSPRYEYRGFMFDVSRHFFTVEEIKKILDEMAGVKLNVFHWHLSDDQGYRIESKRFPKLNEIGSRRIEDDGTESVGFYTEEEIRDVVAYAAARHIDVIPEIDLPGHTSAIVAAYPELSCDGTPGVVQNTGGIYTHILSPGKDETLAFLYELLDEVTELFPSPYFHIGGDEAPKNEWKADPLCQARMKAEGLADEEALQGWLTDKLIAHLKTLGKTTIGWNEMLYAGPREGAIGQYWKEMGPTRMGPVIEAGQLFIFSNNGAAYCDYPYELVTLIGTYSFGGKAENLTVPEEQILGLEIPVWTERISETDHLERQIFPRIQAVAENAWTREKDFKNWKERMSLREEYLKEKGYAFTPVEIADVSGENGIEPLLQAMLKFFGGMKKPVNLPPEMLKSFDALRENMTRECMQYGYTEEQIQQVLKAQEEVMKQMMQG